MPLYIACEHGHVDVARLLLERGAVFEHGSSALCEGDVVRAKYRGRKYYPGKVSRDHGNGRYDIAYGDGEEEKNVVARLIRKLPLSPLTIAKENGHSSIAALLEGHFYPLLAATKASDVDAMALLLDGGAAVDQSNDDDGATPLCIACQKGQVNAARLLLDKGAEVDRAMKDDQTPLFAACTNGHVDVAQLLLSLIHI